MLFHVFVEVLLNLQQYKNCIAHTQQVQQMLPAVFAALQGFISKQSSSSSSISAYHIFAFLYEPTPLDQIRRARVGSKLHHYVSLMDHCKVMMPMNLSTIESNCHYYLHQDQLSVNIVN